MKALVDRAVSKHGRVDVFLNNAGLMPSSMLEKLHVEEWDRMIDVNLKGVPYGIAAVLPIMKGQMGGHIINVSSVAGTRWGQAALSMRPPSTASGDFGRPASGSEALRHPDHDAIPRRGGHRAYGYHQ